MPGHGYQATGDKILPPQSPSMLYLHLLLSLFHRRVDNAENFRWPCEEHPADWYRAKYRAPTTSAKSSRCPFHRIRQLSRFRK